MTKKQINTPSPLTELLISREQFKKELEERLQAGDALASVQDAEQMKKGFKSWDDYNSEYLKQAFNNTANEYRKAYDDAGYSMFGSLSRHEWNSLAEKRETLNYKLDSLRTLIEKIGLLRVSTSVRGIENHKPTTPANMDEVFIVHGHDDLAKIKTARFVEKLGLKPIILHEQVSNGKTIIEKIEAYSNVGFGIVLYTPCDLGGKTSDTLRSRARQNVIFEHGYLIGKIGRKNVCALVKGDIETPNDISGVVYIGMDDADAWQLPIARELKSCGYTIDMNVLV